MNDETQKPNWLFRWKLTRFCCFFVSLDDLWVGLYWERDEGVLYVAPFPALIFGFRIRKPRGDWSLSQRVVELYEALEGNVPDDCSCSADQLQDACACGYDLARSALNHSKAPYLELIRKGVTP